jgi:hypothetical protein
MRYDSALIDTRIGDLDVVNHISAHKTAQQALDVTDEHAHAPSTQAVVPERNTDNSYGPQRFSQNTSFTSVVLGRTLVSFSMFEAKGQR